MFLNFKEISMEEKTFDLLAEGMYPIKCTSCESKMSTKGNEFWSIVFETKDGDKVFDSLFFTEKCLNRVKKYFHVLGLNVDGGFDYQPEDIIGCCMNADITIEDYVDKNGNNKQKNAINLWGCEPYVAKTPVKKVAPKKELEEMPF